MGRFFYFGRMTPESASFRDPAGFVFWHEDRLFRYLSADYLPTYEAVKTAGLWEALQKEDLLIPFQEVTDAPKTLQNKLPAGGKVLAVKALPFFSYPEEWTFGQWKAAARCLLRVQRLALRFGFLLKDAPATNVSFWGAKPLFIDIPSFEAQAEREIWPAYGQFCRHFLAPLALMRYVGSEQGKLYGQLPDGFPLPMSARALPWSGKLQKGLFLHLFAHAKTLGKAKEAAPSAKNAKAGSLLRLTESLQDGVKSVNYHGKSNWADYYENDTESDYLSEKAAFVEGCLHEVKPKRVLDAGANTGVFSALAAKYADFVLALEADHDSAQQLFEQMRNSPGQEKIAPFWIDLTRPTPAGGWAYGERKSLWERVKADLVMALALVHHLRYAAGIPLRLLLPELVARAPYLLIEFVPPTDEKVERLRRGRPASLYADYTAENFERILNTVASCIHKKELKNGRVIYLWKRK